MLKSSLENSKRIVSFGCSLTYGEELEDSTPDGLNFSKLSYAALIAKSVDGDYYSYARPGNGNDSILRKLHSYIKNSYQQGDFVIIGWSSISRIELFNNVTNDYMSLSPGSLESLNNSAKIFNFDNHAQRSVTEIIKAYQTILKFDSDHTKKDGFKQSVFYATCAMQQHDIPFVMIKAMDIDVECNQNNFYDKRSFMEASHYYNKDTGQPFKQKGHPDERMHQHFAGEILDWASQ